MPPIAYVNSNLNDFKRDINIIIYRKNYYVLTDIVIDNFESSIEKYNNPIAFYTISIGVRYHIIRKVIDLLLVPITIDCGFGYESSFYSNEINSILKMFAYKLRIGDKYS